MRKYGLTLVLLLFFLLGLPNAQAATLRLNGIDPKNADGFVQLHPDVTIPTDIYKEYKTTAELASDLLLGSFDFDVFQLDTLVHDRQSIMRKGYCLDLSGSEIIQSAIARMHPAFARQCVLDEKIYAVPYSFQMNYLVLRTSLLEEAGLASAAVPGTFPDFLTFIEQWLDFLQQHPDTDMALLGESYWGDASFYSASSYTAFLVDQLLDSCMMQLEYVQQPTQFDQATLVPLLERCQALGQALYRQDKGVFASRSLIDIGMPTAFPADASPLFFKLSADQPDLISTNMTLCAVSADTQEPQLCMELLEGICQNFQPNKDSLQPQYNTMLYQDTQPLLSPYYEESINTLHKSIQNTKDLLASNPDATTRAQLEDRLTRQQANLDSKLENVDGQYLVSQRDLDAFNAYADCLLVKSPSIFHPNDYENANAFKQLKAKFSSGLITATELINSLNDLAWMIEAEQGN